MSTMAISSGVARRSTLNPNAPLFIPAAFQRVEDFSPEWWELVKNTTWFRDHWFHQHQGEENFDGGDHYDESDDYDVANLLPESFDLELSALESEFDAFEAEQEVFDATFGDEKLKAGLLHYALAIFIRMSLFIRRGNLEPIRGHITQSEITIIQGMSNMNVQYGLIRHAAFFERQEKSMQALLASY